MLDNELYSYKKTLYELNLIFPLLSGVGYILCHECCHIYQGKRLAENKLSKSKGAYLQSIASKNTFTNDSFLFVIFKSVLVILSKKSDYLVANFREYHLARKFYIKNFLS